MFMVCLSLDEKILCLLGEEEYVDPEQECMHEPQCSIRDSFGIRAFSYPLVSGGNAERLPRR
jgi:hypothetical protein